MVSRKKLFLLVILCFSLISSLRAHLTFGFLVGQSWQKPDYREFQFNLDTRWAYGLRAGIKILFFGVEAQYFQVAHNLNLKDIGHSWHNRQVDFAYGGVAAKTYFPFLFFQPYLSLGYGYYGISIVDLVDEKKGGFNFGAGLEISLTEKISLQAEGRFHRPTLAIDQLDFYINDFLVTVGLNWRLF